MTAPKTVERYRYIVDMLSREVATGSDPDTGRALARILAQRSLAKGTRRHYAAAIRFCLDDRGVAAFDEELRKSVAEVRPTTRRQSIVLPQGLFEAVLDKLEENADRWSRATALKKLIVGTRHFGLRPCEWEGARWKDASRTVLLVQNAKFADGHLERGPNAGCVWKRGNGLVRELVLGDVYRGLLSRIADDAMEVARELPYSDPVHGATYRRTHRWALAALREERQFRPSALSRVTIYSYRHAFSSDAKATVDISSGEVAALMGHISTKTAIVSYAKKTARSGRVGIAPSRDSVERVTVKNARFIPERFLENRTADRVKSGIEKPRGNEPSGPNR
ncbi:MAG: hypothetical protein AB7U61_16815 [Methylocystis sp.]